LRDKYNFNTNEYTNSNIIWKITQSDGWY
jgi:hypothetical protein